MDKQILADLARTLEPILPDAAERINCLVSHEPLYDMCVEHEECTTRLRHWADSPDENQDRIAEYRV